MPLEKKEEYHKDTENIKDVQNHHKHSHRQGKRTHQYVQEYYNS